MTSYARPLLVAIVAHYNAGAAAATLKANTSGIFTGRADDGRAFPFLTISLPSAGTDRNFGKKFDTVTVDFNLWDDDRDPDDILSRAGEVESAYRDQIFVVSGFTMLDANKVAGLLIEEPDLEGWHYVTTIEYLLEKA